MDDQRLRAIQLPVPVSFSATGADSDGIEYPTDVIHICQDGFVISSPKKLSLGASLLVKVRRTPLDGSREEWCSGRVVAEQTIRGGVLAYRVEIQAFSSLL
jgi:hypothetical protein